MSTPPQATTWDATEYRTRHAFVFQSSQDLANDWLSPQPGERILDLGCGSGELSALIAQSGAQVLGADASSAMIAAARGTHPALNFEVQNAHSLPYRSEFDAVFSNAALHWMKPLDTVMQRVAAALVPGGRFVLEMGGAGNVQTTLDAVQHSTRSLGLPDLTHPWVFPSTAQLAALLEGAGLRVLRTHWFERPSLLPGEDGFRAWLDSFGSGWLAPLSAEEREAVLTRAAEYARPRLWNGAAWVSDYCRLRALAVKVG
ncbi:methyltransferase domain-containing protein [Deinococcus sp. KNUC1210]|uniref:class I SAM-dependent methyltransferase n=1 Tax=Deinococcus sp. KNUC1210 TaxID=2917691 RepID=UPI001EF0D55D|nr:class I SAM-dependent methyltransferase [Deinococcus sp. KNUC1210]ULH16523.1 methyltransferase domain-containing protein [Deinococcus sp. KNUC1210]